MTGSAKESLLSMIVIIDRWCLCLLVPATVPPLPLKAGKALLGAAFCFAIDHITRTEPEMLTTEAEFAAPFNPADRLL